MNGFCCCFVILIFPKILMGAFKDCSASRYSRDFSPWLALPCKISVCKVQGIGLIPTDWKAPLVWRCDHNRVCLNPVDFLWWQAYLKYSFHYWQQPGCLIQVCCNYKTSGSELFSSCPHGRPVNESNRVEKEKKVCSLRTSAATSHSAHTPSPPPLNLIVLAN